MRFLRKVALLGAVGLGSAVLAGPALARPSLPRTMTTAHFAVHYMTVAPSAISDTHAADVAGLAERAYSAELADGYAAPPSDVAVDGDPHIDIYIDGSLVPSGALAVAVPDFATPQSSGYIALTIGADGLSLHTIAHELFHLIQFGVYDFPAPAGAWMMEGSAEWMGYRADNYQTISSDLGPDDMSLDCLDLAPLGIGCSAVPYEAGGYSRWPFFEYLAEKYSSSFVKDVFAEGAAGAPTATAALAAALTAKGTTLADVYDAWSTAEMTGSYSVKALQSRKPMAYGLPLQTGTTAGVLPTETVPVNHLSTRYLEFRRGGGDGSTACFAATLSLTVTMPAGTLSKPTFFWDGPGSSPVALSINGNTASAAVPWDTCPWKANEGFLSLPNASQNVDAAAFAVSSSLSVNTAQPASPGTAPTPISIWGQVVSVTSAAVPPAITVYGPELLKLSATDKQIRLIVESNGEGSLQASLGSVALGTAALRPGNNDIRFTLPAAVLNALRRSAAVANVLTLTPVSTDGVAKGTPVTRQVSLAAPQAKAKPKVKPKAKPKPKPKSKRK